MSELLFHGSQVSSDQGYSMSKHWPRSALPWTAIQGSRSSFTALGNRQAGLSFDLLSIYIM